MVQVHIVRQTGFTTYEFLVLKRSAGQRIYPSLWQVITGKKRDTETYIQCALREAYEETGLKCTELWALPFVAVFYLPHTDSIHHSPSFGLLVPKDDTVLLSKEHSHYEWLSYEECSKRLVLPSQKEGTKVFLQEILLKEDQELFKIPSF